MAEFDPMLIDKIVAQVLAEINGRSDLPKAAAQNPGNNFGVFDAVDAAVAAAKKAQKQWVQTPKQTKAKVIAALRQAMHEHAEEFARRAWQETGMGRLQDKIVKHHNAADATPGLEDLHANAWTGDNGTVIEDYAPYGVVAAITPSTHPIPVLLNSIIMIIAPGNGAVFSVHPSAKHVSAYAMDIFAQVIRNNGGPENLVCMIREPSMESVDRLFHHEDIPLIAATGGPALVQAAFAGGKKVVAAGPGNPPVLVDDTACLESAARHIIDGASYDNNILCIAEKETFVVDRVFDDFMAAMQAAGAVRLNAAQTDMLTQKTLRRNERGHFIAQMEFIGKNANVLGRACGLELSDEVRLLFGEVEAEHPFVLAEQMMPFMPVVRVQTVQEGVARCVQAEHGFGHTAMIHSNSFDNITAFSKALDTDIVVVNGPSPSGNGPGAGEGYFSHTIASPTGEGVCTPRNFARIRRLAIYRSLQMV